MVVKYSKHYTSRLTDGAYEIKRGLTLTELEEIANDPDLYCIVFEKELRRSDYENLEKYVFSRSPHVLLSKACDFPEPLNLGFLIYMPSVKVLRISGATIASGLDNHSIMDGIEELYIDRCGPEFYDILKTIKPGLKKLSLGTVLSKKLNINFVSRFSQLEFLYVEGHSKGVEAIGGLHNLQELVLRSVSVPDVNFLEGLKKLWSLNLKLGTIKDLSVLPRIQLRYLELWFVKGFSDISFIAEMTSLQNLHLESLSSITALPSLERLPKLKRVRLMNLVRLQNFAPLRSAPGLSDFFYTLTNKHQPEDLIPVLQHPNVKHLYVYFPSDKKNTAFEMLANRYGKNLKDWPDFVYDHT